MDGEYWFTGEAAPKRKNVVKNVARMALLFFKPLVDQAPPQTGTKRKDREGLDKLPPNIPIHIQVGPKHIYIYIYIHMYVDT